MNRTTSFLLRIIILLVLAFLTASRLGGLAAATAADPVPTQPLGWAPTNTPTPAATPTFTPTFSPTPTHVPAPTATPTFSPTPTHVPTPTATPASPPTFIVNVMDDTDDGACTLQHCSLREAINATNAHPNADGPDVIQFDLPAQARIQPLSALPAITDPVIIDGSTRVNSNQSLSATDVGAMALRMSANSVELDGSAAGAGVSGLVFETNDSLLRGFIIHSFASSGVVLKGDGNALEGNYIGTTGFDNRGNGLRGVYIDHGDNNRIGGQVAGSGNLISGNGASSALLGAGVYILGGAGNLVQGNFIGVDAFGVATIPNRRGVKLLTTDSTIIGGERSGARNLISGNEGPGVETQGDKNLVIQGNVIGLNLDGSSALGNQMGVLLYSVQDSVLGRSEDGSGLGNIIVGNREAGVELQYSHDNAICDNQIGTTLTGAQMGNAGPGVLLRKYSRDNALFDNRIAFNGDAGILVDGALDEGFLSNTIYDNLAGIRFVNSDNMETPPPQITQVTANTVRGTAPPNS